MLSSIVVDGDKVELVSVDHLFAKEGEPTKKYSTRVYSVLSDDRLEIMMPMEKAKLILLPVDGEYDLCFYTSQGLYQCYARIYDRYKSNNVYVLALELTSNLRKHQRREYYRFSCVLDMKSRELKPEETESLKTFNPIIVPGLPLRRSLICDISGGGMRFITDTVYPENAMIYCTFSLNLESGPKDYDIVAKVLTVREVPSRPGEHEHRVQYEGLDRDTREEIIKFIFDEERKLRRKARR
ncbi:MAG: flagellar brake protein [Lachnospiraceae bacterium]|nr:flagellar brake protein [Lachnospiraceae bacterium]